MDAQTLTPCADADADADAGAAAPQTLAAGELVWAKPAKPRRHCWWPARLLAACPASAISEAQVSYFGDSAGAGAPSAPPAQVRRFADPGADVMVRGSTARAFFVAVAEAHARAVAALRAELTCGCLPPPSPGEDSSVVGVTNLAPEEFLGVLREAALDVSLVGLVDRARLKSWVLAVAEGWGPDGARHYPRRSPEDLVDKIDLDVPAGDDRDAEDWLPEYEHKALGRPEETHTRKKRSVTTVIEELDAGYDEVKSDSHGTLSSGKRERKKSKYLSPPYTSLGVAVLPRKPFDSKPLVPKAAEDGNKVLQLPGSVIVEDVLLLVQGLGKGPHHQAIFPEAAEEFLSLFRSSIFIDGADYKSYKAHECPVMRISRNVDMDIDGNASMEKTVLEADNLKNEQSAVADVSDKNVSKETTKSEANTYIDENLESAADVPVISGPSPMHEDVQPIDENKEPGAVEVCTVQQSYASLQAMVPGILEKENITGTDVTIVNHALNDEYQKDEQLVQKVKLPFEAVAHHSYGEGVNGICPDPANPTKETKKAAQHFGNPAAILVEFAPGVVVPSREVLLSTFGKYGNLIDSQTEIIKGTRSARVVFGKSIEAEEAYRNQQLLGQFGPPFATARLSLNYLPPIKLSMPSPLSPPSLSPSLASKLPLSEIRKNLEAMISARHSALNKETSSDVLNPVPDKLLGDMQGLLAKVNKMITRPSANTL